jgi:hypothetical protein
MGRGCRQTAMCVLQIGPFCVHFLQRGTHSQTQSADENKYRRACVRACVRARKECCDARKQCCDDIYKRHLQDCMVLNVVMASTRMHRWYVSQESIVGVCPERRLPHACMQCTHACSARMRTKVQARARRYDMLGFGMLGYDMVGYSGVFV